ncbi:MAG: DinB family protein [Chloroflexota bacterium]
MNLQNILLLYEYNYWATGQILAAAAKVTEEQFLAPGDFPFGGLRGTLVHIIDAEYGWRWLFERNAFTDDLKADEFPTFQSVQERAGAEEQAMRAYLAALKDEDMESHVRYTTDTGIERDRILWHCLVHMVNHGTQHRSEAAALLTRCGQSPGDLDVTVFLNQYKA